MKDFAENLTLLAIGMFGVGFYGHKMWREFQRWRHRDDVMMRPYYDDYPDKDFRL